VSCTVSGQNSYSDRGPTSASITRFASITVSSLGLFSRLAGLSANGWFTPGGKIFALKPFPKGLTTMRKPLYSRTVILFV
jgi:hypothetical protein